MTKRLFAVVGDPVAHSLSPAMHGAAIAALGIDAEFVALRTTHAAFPALVAELLAAGGGCSVTTPFKDDAFALRGRHTEAAQRTRAVNCVAGPASDPLLDNTDVAGVVEAARQLVGDTVVTTARIFGTGGAARAAACAVSDAWPGAVVGVVSRDQAREREFLDWAAGAGVTAVVAPRAWVSSEDLWINATPLLNDLPARAGDACDDPEYDPPGPGAFLDLNYRPGSLLAKLFARIHNCPSADGRGVLVAQGAAAFERFFGLAAPREVMSRAVDEALAAADPGPRGPAAS
jgi:shikimate dehydrogenase